MRFVWLMHWVNRLLSAMWVGLMQSMEGLNKAKKVGVGCIHSLPNYLSWDNSLFLFRAPHSQAFKCRLSSVPLNRLNSAPGSPACAHEILGLVSPPRVCGPNSQKVSFLIHRSGSLSLMNSEERKPDTRVDSVGLHFPERRIDKLTYCKRNQNSACLK